MSVESMIGDATANVEASDPTAKNNTGGFTQTWHPLYGGIRIRDEITGSRIEDRFGQKVIITTHMVYTMQSGITLGMRFVYGGAYLNVIAEMQRRERSPAIPTWYEYVCEETKQL